MPPGRRIHVKGKCIYPSNGWTVTLEKRVPQGANPAVLMLDKVADPPRGQSAQVQTTYDPTYDQRLEDRENYETVTIMPDNISVKVEVVH